MTKKSDKHRVHGRASDDNAWVLLPSKTTETEVAWCCTGCRRYVTFARVGLGEPSSTETEVPWDAHVYCGDTCEEHIERLNAEVAEDDPTDHHTATTDELAAALAFAQQKPAIRIGRKPARPGHR